MGVEQRDKVEREVSRRKPVGAAADKPKRGRNPIPRLRQRILESALELFGQRGFEAVLVDEVAAHAGIGKGSVYRQFHSKEQLHAAAANEGFRRLRGELEQAVREHRSERELLDAIASRLVDYFWNRRQFLNLLRESDKLTRRQIARFQAERQKLHRVLGRVLASGTKAGHLRADLRLDFTVEAFLGMIRGIQVYRAPDTTREEVVRTVVTLFLEGMAGPSRRASEGARASGSGASDNGSAVNRALEEGT